MQRIVQAAGCHTSAIYRIIASALALLLVIAFSSPFAAPAWAAEGENAAGNEAVAPEVIYELQTVYVYVEAVPAEGEDAVGGDGQLVDEGRANEHGYYTIGTIQLELPVDASHGTALDVTDYADAIAEALGDLERFEANADFDLSTVVWTKLAVAQGATDYPDAPALAWHLDGRVTAGEPPVVPGPVDPDPEPGPEPEPTPDPEPVPDPKPEPAPKPEPTPRPEVPSVPVVTLPTVPSAPQATPSTNPTPEPPAPRSDVRTTILPRETAAAAPAEAAPVAASVAEEVPAPVAIMDDAAPLVARAGESIAEEEVPLGAFDEPVDPAPWVAGMGAIGTALYATLAVRRRLLMTQRLQSFEAQVLGTAAEPSPAPASANAHQAL